MKKILLAVILISSSLLVAAQDGQKPKNAENNDRMPFCFGPKVGLTYTRLSTKSVDDNLTNLKNSNRLSLQAGLFARIYYHKLYFQPELDVTWRGGTIKYDMASTANSIKQKMNITSIDLPLLIGYTFGRNFLNFRLYAGPMVGYTMSQKLDITTSDGSELTPEQKFNNKDATWGITGGIGFDVWKFTMDLRYERGLNDVSWNSSVKQRPSNLMLTVGWKTF